jgi:hypothetical protein
MASLEAGDLGVPEPSSSAASSEPSFIRFKHAMHASMIRTVTIKDAKEHLFGITQNINIGLVGVLHEFSPTIFA